MTLYMRCQQKNKVAKKQGSQSEPFTPENNTLVPRCTYYSRMFSSTADKLIDTAPCNCACVPRLLDRNTGCANSWRCTSLSVARHSSGWDPTPPPSTTTSGFSSNEISAIASARIPEV